MAKGLKGLTVNSKELKFTTKNFNAGMMERIPLPTGKKISGIRIKHNKGSLTVGGSATAWSDGTNGGNANSLLKSINLEVNTKPFEDWNGYAPADVEPFGLEALREFNKFQNGVAQANEVWLLDFPDALPEKWAKDLIFEWNSLANIGKGTTPTAYSGSVTIYLILEDKLPRKKLFRKVSKGKRGVGASLQDDFSLKPTTKGFSAAYLVMHFTDNVSEDLSDSEKQSVYLEIKKGAETIFKGNLEELEEESDLMAVVAMGSSWAIKEMGMRQWSSEEFRIDVDVKTALSNTNLDIHYWLVEYAYL